MEKLMGPDERDRQFDKALSRHLRSVAPSGAAANSPADAAFERVSCPDLESLAAYHERSLVSKEMNSLKEHIVGCAHCQSILAQLEVTDEIPLQAATQEDLLALKESQSRLAAQGRETLPSAAATQQAAAAPSRQAREIRHFPGPRWKWLAPAGALATGLLVWIAIHKNPPLPLPNANEVKVASNQPPVSPSLSAPTGAIRGVPAPSSKPDLTKQQYAADEIASSNLPASSEVTDLRQRKFESPARIAPSKTLAGKESAARDKESTVQKDTGRGASAGVRKDPTREVSADAITTATQADLDAKNLPTTARQSVEVQAEAQAVIVQQQSQSAANLQQQNQNVQLQNQQVQNQNAHDAQKSPGPASMERANSEKKLKAAPPAPASPKPRAPAAPTASGGLAGFTSGASMEAVLIFNPRLIAVPGSKVIWRVGRSGLIEFSADGGISWSRQTSGTPADLITGSAPSDQVCWIVGRAGTVLLTTDAGAHWKLLSAPMPDDLGGVQASDALHARVWNSLNTKSFETSDGGVTWKRFVNE
jgi:hypothetical protein